MILRYVSVIFWLTVAAFSVVACGGATSDSGGGTTSESRTVEHAMGETKITGTPERVVVLDTGELDSAMTLGIKPIGAVEAVEGMGYPSYLEGTEEIENVGTIQEPNLEKIASLEPDLILSSKLRHEQIYDQLSQMKQKITGDPLWQQLEAIQQERVYEVSDDLWMLGIGYTAANGVVDDLTKDLIKERTG